MMKLPDAKVEPMALVKSIIIMHKLLVLIKGIYMQFNQRSRTRQ